MLANFSLYSRYYNLLYNDKDYDGEVAYVVRLILADFKEASAILELGSGTGKHALSLKGLGFTVYGIERSESMVNEAIKNGIDCQVADICKFDLGRTFDAVISLFHVISYLTSNDELIDAFDNANRHLKNGGIFLFDVWYSPAVYEQKALPRIKQMKNSEIEVTRIAEPVLEINRNVVDVGFTVLVKDLKTNQLVDFNELHPMRHFSIPEILLLAQFCGFKLLKSEEFLTGNVPSVNTWGVCFVLQKTKDV